MVAKLKGTRSWAKSLFHKLAPSHPALQFYLDTCITGIHPLKGEPFKHIYYNMQFNNFKNNKSKFRQTMIWSLLFKKSALRTVFYSETEIPWNWMFGERGKGRLGSFLFVLNGISQRFHTPCALWVTLRGRVWLISQTESVFYDAAAQRACALKNTLLLGEIMPLVWHCHCFKHF